MAKATWLRQPQPVPPPDAINLVLTLEEAKVLKAVMGGITGRLNGPQEKTGNIFWALADAGVKVAGNLELTSPIYLNESEEEA